MDACDPTGVLFTKIRRLEPDYASKVIGYILLQDLNSRDLMRLALGSESLLQSLILKVKSELGISSNGFSSPPSPSPLNPISRPINIHPLSQSSPRLSGNGYFEFSRNPSSPSAVTSRSNSGPFQTPSLLHQCSSAADVTDENQINDDLLDENQFGDYLSFLNDSSSKTDKPTDQFTNPANNGDTHLHKRSFSANDVCFGSEERGFRPGYNSSLYFTKGFSKNGDACSIDEEGGIAVGSPNAVEYAYQQQEEMMRMKAANRQRLAAAHFMAGVPPMPYDKSSNFLLHQRNLQRPAPMLVGEEGYWYGSPGRRERDDYIGMRFDHSNSASRQIYLTFPADSSFKDEDVSNYFNIFGPVQDVRIPYQQKRMFGFVTFVHSETVRMILARGNPHFICDSRVLVKPYKEKGKILDKRQQQHLQHQQMERGNFSPCSSPSGIGSRESFDFHSGPGMFYDTQEMMERKMEQTDVHQALEYQRRRLMHLQFPDAKNDSVRRHQHSLSIGSPVYFSSLVDQNAVPESENAIEEAIEDDEDKIKQDLDPETFKTCTDYGKRSETSDLNLGQEMSLEKILPDSLFSSPTKPSDVRQSDPIQASKSISVSLAEPIQLA